MEAVVGVAGIIPQGDTVLVLRRSRTNHFLPGAWDLPGGRLEPGEAPEEGVVREALEETGLRTKVVRSLGSRSYPLDPNSERRGRVMNAYLLKARGELRIRLSDEHDAYRWVPDSDLTEIFAANDLMRSVIHQYFESEQNSQD